MSSGGPSWPAYWKLIAHCSSIVSWSVSFLTSSLITPHHLFHSGGQSLAILSCQHNQGLVTRAVHVQNAFVHMDQMVGEWVSDFVRHQLHLKMVRVLNPSQTGGCNKLVKSCSLLSSWRKIGSPLWPIITVQEILVIQIPHLYSNSQTTISPNHYPFLVDVKMLLMHWNTNLAGHWIYCNQWSRLFIAQPSTCLDGQRRLWTINNQYWIEQAN